MVDDDEDDRDLFREALAEVAPDIDLVLAEDAADALQKLKTQAHGIPDLLFLDVNLPIMSGWECLSSIKMSKELRDIPVIMYSTSSRPHEERMADELGALCFITKPQSFTLLKSVLASAVLCISQNQPELLRQRVAPYQS